MLTMPQFEFDAQFEKKCNAFVSTQLPIRGHPHHQSAAAHQPQTGERSEHSCAASIDAKGRPTFLLWLQSPENNKWDFSNKANGNKGTPNTLPTNKFLPGP